MNTTSLTRTWVSDVAFEGTGLAKDRKDDLLKPEAQSDELALLIAIGSNKKAKKGLNRLAKIASKHGVVLATGRLRVGPVAPQSNQSKGAFMNHQDEDKGWPNHLWSVVKESAEAVPANNLVKGVVGLGAAVALILTFTRDVRAGIFGSVIVLGLAGLLIVLGWAKDHTGREVRIYVNAFLVIVMLAFCLILGLLVSTFAAGWPEHATKVLYSH